MHIRDFDPGHGTWLPRRSCSASLGYPTTADALRRRVAANAGDPAVKVLVADHLERIVGVLVLHVITPWHEDTRWALVSALVVDDAARSQGTGAALLREAETFAIARGCSRIELSSNEKRLRAHAFYERAGFEERRKRFVKPLPVSASDH